MDDLGAFFQDAVRRHALFVKREAAASTDQEALELFADYIINDSRLRRVRYVTRITADFDSRECNSCMESARLELDNIQRMIEVPLTALFTKRIDAASATMDALYADLADEAQNRSPNLIQEEGDEQPELLEKLALLKWLFEAREQLHHKVFTLQNSDDAQALVEMEDKIRWEEERLTNDLNDKVQTIE